METFTVEIKGTHPLLMHSAKSIDPTDQDVVELKKITSKKKKTEADYADIDRRSYLLALEWNDKYVFIPDTSVIGSIRSGAAVTRQGNDILSGVEIVEPEIPLLYDGPQTPETLYEAKFADRRAVVVNQKRIMRVRPRFTKWGLKFTLVVDEAVISPTNVKDALEYAGRRKGLGDFRPRFGRFEVTKWNAAK